MILDQFVVAHRVQQEGTEWSSHRACQYEPAGSVILRWHLYWRLARSVRKILDEAAAVIAPKAATDAAPDPAEQTFKGGDATGIAPSTDSSSAAAVIAPTNPGKNQSTSEWVAAIAAPKAVALATPRVVATSFNRTTVPVLEAECMCTWIDQDDFLTAACVRRENALSLELEAPPDASRLISPGRKPLSRATTQLASHSG